MPKKLAALMTLGAMIALPACALAQNHQHSHANGHTQDASPSWQQDEAGILANHVQLTSRDDFIRAGEAYFSPDGKWIIFQAIPTPAFGNEPRQHYSMFVARLDFDAEGHVTGIKHWKQVSRPAAATTCGFFHPTVKGRIIFGSTMIEPTQEETPGYQREKSRYAWAFPREMEIVSCIVPMIVNEEGHGFSEKDASVTPRPLFEREGGYDAECGFSPDGRHIVFASVDPETHDADLFVYDTATSRTHAIIEAEGYDGGPFFSPDGSMICYRSDRAGNDLLQLFVAELEYDATGAVIGMKEERQVTSNRHVNWAPFWHPSGEFLIYATSEVGHHNYEVFSIEVPRGSSISKGPNELKHRRLTSAPGFDGLPVFSPDGSRMMWTSQRGPKIEGEDRPSSQLWVADVIDVAPGGE